MDNLKDRIVKEVQEIDTCSSSTFELAAYFLEKSGGKGFDEVWPDELLGYEISDRDTDEVSDALVNYLESNASEQLKASAIWALGKTKNTKYKSVYIGFIKSYNLIESTLLYQALVALGDLEMLTSGDVSLSLFDSDGNKLLAKEYLEKLDGR